MPCDGRRKDRDSEPGHSGSRRPPAHLALGKTLSLQPCFLVCKMGRTNSSFLKGCFKDQMRQRALRCLAQGDPGSAPWIPIGYTHALGPYWRPGFHVPQLPTLSPQVLPLSLLTLQTPSWWGRVVVAHLTLASGLALTVGEGEKASHLWSHGNPAAMTTPSLLLGVCLIWVPGLAQEEAMLSEW